MINYYIIYLVPLAYIVPAVIAFYVGFLLRKKSSRTHRLARMFFYLCLAQGIHNTYYFIATLFRNYDTNIFETMMLPVPWLLIQGIIAIVFLFIGFVFIRERDIEIGDIRIIKENADKFKELALIDPLTNLNNRRSLDDKLEKEKIRADRMLRPFTLMMIDLDGFKKYNDNHGHHSGDQLLVSIANVIKTNLRDHIDISFRYGGDEFFVIMPETVLSEARQIAHRLNESIKSQTNEIITSSIGLLEVSPDCLMKPYEMIRLTDIIMYSAKKEGGNQISYLIA